MDKNTFTKEVNEAFVDNKPAKAKAAVKEVTDWSDDVVAEYVTKNLKKHSQGQGELSPGTWMWKDLNKDKLEERRKTRKQ